MTRRGVWRVVNKTVKFRLATGRPSSKYEHWRASALLRDIQNIIIIILIIVIIILIFIEGAQLAKAVFSGALMH